MLEFYTEDSTKVIEDLKDFITIIFVIVDEYIKNRINSNHSKMSAGEIIIISLVGEFMYIDLENTSVGYYKNNLKELFLSHCSQTGFHRTRRALYKGTELIRYKLI